MGRKPAPWLGPFFEMSYLGSHCLVSQKATPGRVTEIIRYLGTWGEVIMSKHGGYERKSPVEAGDFTENYIFSLWPRFSFRTLCLEAY